ncbi:endonuclease/exonuclease/phosphatase family protein [Candidatus Kaiserbacteria bacterium]|nr:endonuclease/exonuclease/phosphatase family protein [Candidatus Kaiserbacteria bacterium]
MRILSFNVYKKNARLAELVSFLKEEGPDVICLQEFPVQELSRLGALTGYHRHLAEEQYTHKKKPHRSSDLRLVILSRFPIENAESVRHLAHAKVSLRNRVSHAEVAVYFHFVDIVDRARGPMRIFNCHLECTTSPAQRITQFKEILRHRDLGRLNVVCGDLNTFNRPLIGPFVFWLFGYKLKQLWIHEHKVFQKIFSENNLRSAVGKHPTFTYLPFQLDHILVPKEIRVTGPKVFKKSYGSDHYAIAVEL